MFKQIHSTLQRIYSGTRSSLYWSKMERLFHRLHEKAGGRVLFGPFQGMLYPIEVHKADRCPMLLGSYEHEIHQALGELSKQPFAKVIDIGCAEGYYAVGFALMFPSAKVYAFDIDPVPQAACALFSAKNNVSERVEIKGECTHEWLRANVAADSLIMCDCEGAELEILSPAKVPQLARATMIIELHDNLRPGVSDQFLPVFRETHDLELLVQETDKPLEKFATRLLSQEELKLAASEYRNGIQTWAILRPKNLH